MRRNRLIYIAAAMISVCAAIVALSASPVCPETRADSEAVTFSKDVAPIFFKNCTICHRPGETAPMSLLTYKEARPWARSIKEKVLNRIMPPWHADAEYGKFENDRRLSSKDIDTIAKWVDGGALEGDPRDLPPIPSFAEGWKIGKPDVVLTMPVKFEVPAKGVVDYKYFSVPTNFTQDRWVHAAEVRPGNPAVVHHVIVYIRKPQAEGGRNPAGDGDDGLDGLTGVAPGEEPTVLPDGVGILVPADSELVFQVHYTPNGVAQSDQTSVGLIFCKRPVVKADMGGAAMNTDFKIPSGDPNFEVRSSATFDEDSHILSLMPHMHMRGKDFQYKLVYPDGTSNVILSVPHWDFNWQTDYTFAEPVAAPKGSRLQCTAHFDNSAANKANPDPSKTVGWGPQTWDEMMIGFFDFTLDHQNLQRDGDLKPAPSIEKTTTTNAPPPETAASAAMLPSVDLILDRYVQAIGGKEAIRAQSSLVVKGTLKVPSIGADGTYQFYAKAPNKELTEISSGFLGGSKTGFNGVAGWSKEDGGARDLPDYPKQDADFYLPVKLLELYPRMRVQGKQKFNGSEVYVLEAPRLGSPKLWYFDAESGLLLRVEERSAKGKILHREDYQDYRSVDGVKIPFTTHELDGGVEVITMVTEAKYNASIDDAVFEKPASQ